MPEERVKPRFPESARLGLAVVLYGLLADVLIEGWIDAAETRWVTTVVVLAYGVVSYLLWKRMSWGLRAAATLLVLLALLAVSSWLLGSASAAAGLVVLRQPPGRIAALVGLGALALGYAMVARHSGLPVRARAAIAVVFVYCALPLVAGVFTGASFEETLSGVGFWEWPPLWLQGGFLGMRVLLPLTLLAALVFLATQPTARQRDNLFGRLLEAAVVLLAVLIVQPSLSGSGASPRSREILGERVAVERSRENPILRISVDAFVLEEERLGEKTLAGSRFLSLSARIANQSAEKRLSIPFVEQTFVMEQADGTQGRLHPLSGKSDPPFWGSVELAPGEERNVEMVFSVTAAPIAEAILVFARTDQGSLAVPMADPKKMMPPLAGPAAANDVELSVRGIERTKTVAGELAPEGRIFLTVDLRLRNLLEIQPLDTIVSDLCQLVEDGRYLYSLHPLTKALSPRLVTTSSFLARIPVAGTLVFLIPEQTGDLALHYRTAAGAIVLDLTPGRRAPKRPESAAGPVGKDARVSVSLLRRDADLELPPASGGQRSVVLDVLLGLNVDDAMASFAFNPADVLELHDARGGVYRTAEVGASLRRPLGPVELWQDQPAGGEIAFVVPEASSSFTLVLPFSGTPVRLPVPESLLSD